MGKAFLLAIAIVLFQFAYGQKIKFEFKRATPCDPTGTIDSSYYILTDENDSSYVSKDGIVILPKPGSYNIFMWSEPDANFPTIHIEQKDSFTYVYNEPKISKRSYGMHGRIVYESCGQLLNGYHEDYYVNGKIKIRGNFQEGKPKDSIVIFYWNGMPEKRLTYLPKEILIEEYDSSFNLIRISHNSNKSYYLTDYRKLEYYTNGKVKLLESSNNGVVLMKEYYTNRQVKTIQTKKYRTEFFDNGKVETDYRWKRKRDKVRKGEHRYEFIVTKRIYDIDGTIKEKVKFENWSMIQLQPFFEIRRSDWIDSWVKYENGKETIIATSVATKEYFNKN